MKYVLLVLSVFTLAKGISQSHQVSTLAGSGSAALVDGIGTGACLNAPYELVSDGADYIYFCDTYNHAVRRYEKGSGEVVTIAGTGVVGFTDGPCASATFNYPEGIVIYQGALYIGDNYNHAIRKIELNTNQVSTVAGTGAAGYQDGSAGAAQFHNPKFITLGRNGDIYVSDYVNRCIRKIRNGQVTTVAGVPGVSGYVDGPGLSAKFGGVSDLCMDTVNEILYLTDNYNHVVRKIDASGNVNTYAGTGNSGHLDGPRDSAEFQFPSSLELTANGTLYISGGAGGDNTIRKIDPAGHVSTVAGAYGAEGFQDGSLTEAEFYWVYGVAFDNKECALYIADSFNNRIRKISRMCDGPEDHLNNIGMHAEMESKIFPNPSNGVIHVNLGETCNCKYDLLNSLGMIIKSGTLSKPASSLDFSDLSNGIYFLQIGVDSQTNKHKIIIEK